MAADERFLAVDDDDLAMVAVVQHADVAQRSLVEERHPAAGVAHPLHDFLSGLLGALGVQQHAHLHAGPGAVDQRVGHAPAQLPVLPQEGLEMHGVAGCTDALDEHVEEGAVLVHLDLVAGHGRAQRQARQARHELVDRVVAIDLQRGVAVAADRPDHQDLDGH